jgi:L-fucose isomerase-like protein
MPSKPSRFALFFGNRAFFPSAMISTARRQMEEVLAKLGHETILMDKDATRFGAVETPDEGRRYASFLEQNRGRFDGIILCMPNFSDENGAAEALRHAGVPILIQAYPDEMDKLAPEFRRDAFCGKISIMDVFFQQGIQYTALKPHVVDPAGKEFAANIDHFDRVCRTVAGMRDVRVGAIGARTSPFKTVRIDEVALQRKGVTVETYDLSSIIAQVKATDTSSDRYRAKADFMKGYSDWSGVPDEAFANICKLGAALDEMVERDGLDCLAIRCWTELQQQLKVSPCVLLSELNDRGVPFACEVDVGSAVAMHALSLAAGSVSACLDWNNNYGDDPDKCILFHCGPVPQTMMIEKGRVEDHAIMATAMGHGCSFGCNVGRIKPSPMTYGCVMSHEGRLRMFAGEGEFTADPIPKEFFGVAGVVKIPNLQDVLLMIGREGFRHHVAVTSGSVREPLSEAMEKYLGYEMVGA